MTTTSPQDPKCKRYILIVEYDGTRFKGFQRQEKDNDNDNDNKKKNNSNDASQEDCPAPLSDSRHFRKRRRYDATGRLEVVTFTIQECLEDALMQYSGLSRSDLVVRFAGRTDAGVHARGQVVAVNLPYEEVLWKIRRSINSRLPVDISIQSVSLCPTDDFDPRRHVTIKQYSYTLKFRRRVVRSSRDLSPLSQSGMHTIRNGLDPSTIWVCPWSLDDSKLDEICHKLMGEHDYSAFVHKDVRHARSNILTIQRLAWEQLSSEIRPDEEREDLVPAVTVRFIVESKGFRRSMVRNLVGFIVDICRGAVDESIFDVLWSGAEDVATKVHAAPACGLCLEYVRY